MGDTSFSIRGIRKDDYDYLVTVLDRWWGGPSGQRADPIFFYELGADALIATDEEERVIGFLLGFIHKDFGYVHLVGIEPGARRRGVGKSLYERFIDRCRAIGARRLKAIAAIGNENSEIFHRALGFEVAIDKDYAGPGRGRMVFSKQL